VGSDQRTSSGAALSGAMRPGNRTARGCGRTGEARKEQLGIEGGLTGGPVRGRGEADDGP
jgi:hypothetical protein